MEKKYEQEFIIYCIMSKPARQQRSRKTSTIMINVPVSTRHHLQKREYVKANKRLLLLDIHEAIVASTRRHGGVVSSESLPNM